MEYSNGSASKSKLGGICSGRLSIVELCISFALKLCELNTSIKPGAIGKGETCHPTLFCFRAK
jgi:hypothetical protein